MGIVPSMNLSVSYPNAKVEYKQKKIKLAYIKHNFERYGFPELNYFPDVIMMNDVSGTSQLGRNIPVKENWWRYIEKINNPLGYKYARSIQMMWVNIGYDNDVPYSTAKAEAVHCGGNFVSWDIETSTHIRLISWANDYDTSKLNPAVHNWRTMPYMFWKACSVERFGSRVRNVGADLDVYFPFICNTPQFGLPAELWMEKSKVELLGEEAFTFNNGNVYLDNKLFRATGTIPPK